MSEEKKNKYEKVSLPPSALLYPVPVVLVSCAGKDEKSKPNMIAIAWAGTACSDPPMVTIAVRKSRHSFDLIEKTGEFVINLVSKKLLKACDYCGVHSGRDVDKFEALGLTPVPAEKLDYAPAVLEAPLSLSCKVTSVTPCGAHELFLAEIVGVTVNQSLIDKAGKLHLDQADLVTYCNMEYFRIGEYLGFFGYSVATKEARKRKRKEKEKSNKKNKK